MSTMTARRMVFPCSVFLSVFSPSVLVSCMKTPTELPSQTIDASKPPDETPPAPPVTPSMAPQYTVAVVGDFGSQDAHEDSVAKLIKSWNPLEIITTGDNIYPDGGGSYDDAVGAYYADYIGDYKGTHGVGAMQNHFWPVPGNHDWAGNEALAGFRAFFTLPPGPGGERYYDRALDAQGLVHLYVLDSDSHEPDGIRATSKQALWLEETLKANAASACFHVVAFHHPPYTTLTGHRPATALRWPFKAWGADLVLTGHNHHYERLNIDGLPYIVSGNGGAHLYEHQEEVAEGSLFFDDTHYGALRLGIARGEIHGQAFAAGVAAPVDTFLVKKSCAK